VQYGSRPVFLIGHGVRASGVDVEKLLSIGIPILSSWQVKDLIDNDHPLNFGCPGQYGQRLANKVFYEADHIICVGNRMAIWNVGYEGPRPEQRLTMIDIDPSELYDAKQKWPQVEPFVQDAKAFIESISDQRPDCSEWVNQCEGWRKQYPWVESPAHDDRAGYISPYLFMERLQKYLRPDEVIVTDMGTALITAHQVLRLKPPQRIMTSGGLGEMGCALPAAVGASFARNKGEVLCLHCDGGMMMNLQELQTIIHHQLPVKIIVFSNDGYGMIKETQKKAGMPHVGTDSESGVSMPSFRRIAHSLGMRACDVRSWNDFYQAMPALFASKVPSLVEVHIAPDFPMVPKLDPIYINGKPTSPRFCDMSPALKEQ